MTIHLLQVGKTNKSYWQEAVGEYEKRLQRYVKFRVSTVPEPRNAKHRSPSEIRKLESEQLQKHLVKTDRIILLDEKGREYDSKAFSEKLNQFMISRARDITFVIGGAYGIADDLKQKADEQIALSRMTFPHQLARPVFLEQLYRAFTILKGEPYHN